MSTLEDVELRDLVAQTLEKNGCLAKLRAELRASIFLALDEDEKLSKQEPLQNLRVQSYLETPEGRVMFCLVREFLEFFNLQFTISVYEPESYLDSIYQYEGRQKIAKDLGLSDMEEPTVPLLQILLKMAQTKSNVLDINLNVNSNINGNLKDDSIDNVSSYNETDCNSIPSKTNVTSEIIKPTELNKKSINSDVHNLNTTFDVKSPTINLSEVKRLNEINGCLVNKVINNLIKEDDTYEDTSSIAEDSEGLPLNKNKNSSEEKESKISLPESINETETSLTSKIDSEKSKLSPQKPKTSLSSLTDLPPLPINKSRVGNDILPSLYSKDFKDRPNLKEIDKMFDMEVEYEEDFMYSSNELSLKSDSGQTNISLLNNGMVLNKTDSEKVKSFHQSDSQSASKSVAQNNCSAVNNIESSNSNSSVNANSISD